MAYDQVVKATINGTDVVPIVNAAPQANTTGNITTSSTTIVATDMMGIGSATVQISGTHAGINMIFEASADAGTTWFPVQGINQSTNALTTAGATGVIATNATVVWTVSPLLGQSQFRVRSTAFTSGSGAIVIHPSTQFIALPIATQPVSGTVTATVASTTITSLVPGVAATSLGKAEDAVHASGDTGVQILAVRNDNAATSLTSATGDYSPVAVDTNGTVFVRDAPAITPTNTQITPATSSTTIKASNAARRSLVLYNGGTSNCYITYGATSSSTAYTFILGSDSGATIDGKEYSGIVTGIWVATGGNSMQVTEIV